MSDFTVFKERTLFSFVLIYIFADNKKSKTSLYGYKNSISDR